ncbi:unnamed protein product [Pleuronectes platessa]|uniref:Secreted protein n=1 Tax=Pleuronectes platessa TaxID=8262 RepID=A0A9N7V392_PLEPL|nr:unnamed protein product [Pleuronectes platessa]
MNVGCVILACTLLVGASSCCAKGSTTRVTRLRAETSQDRRSICVSSVAGGRGEEGKGNKAGQPLKPPCRPGFSQNFYTVIVSRDVLHGQSILKETDSERWGKDQRDVAQQVQREPGLCFQPPNNVRTAALFMLRWKSPRKEKGRV